jgi:hypothetical protein
MTRNGWDLHWFESNPPQLAYNVLQMFMAAFAKPLLCAGRFISTKFNLKTKI